LEDWTEKLKLANWEQPADMKQSFNTVDLLGKSSCQVVFDIAGNNYNDLQIFIWSNAGTFVCLPDGDTRSI